MWDIQVRISDYWELMKQRKLDESEQDELRLLLDEQAECINEIKDLRDRYHIAKMTGDREWAQEILDQFHDLQRKLIY